MLRAVLTITLMTVGTHQGLFAQARDNAGGKVVVSSAAMMNRHLPWRIDLRPRVEVGGDDASALGSVAGGLLLPGGRFAVLDGRNRELRIYEANGSLISKAGRRGSGPGEFQNPALSPSLYKDSIPISEMLGRVSLFNAAGKLGRSVDARAQIGSPRGVVGGMLVTTRGSGFGALSAQAWNKTSLSVEYVDLSNGQRREIFNIPGPMTFFAVSGGADAMSDPARRPKARIIASPMSADPSVVAQGSQFWATDGLSYSIVCRNQLGAIQTVYRIDALPPAINANALRAEKRRLVEAESNPDLSRHIETALEKAPTPTRQAAFDKLVADGSAGVWARVYQPDGGSTKSWVVFDARGIAQGTLSLPAALDVMNVEGTRILGRMTDDDDVQRAVVVTLVR